LSHFGVHQSNFCFLHTGTKSDFTLPPIENNNVLKRLPPSYLSKSVNDFYSVSESKFASKSAVMKPSRHNKFHEHAKQGFEYWPQDRLLNKQHRAKNCELSNIFIIIISYLIIRCFACFKLPNIRLERSRHSSAWATRH
jgi:hypothetical protein